MMGAPRGVSAAPESAGETTAAHEPALRSLLYRSFATAFEYPDRDTLGIIREGALADALRQMLGALDLDLVKEIDWGALCDAGPDDDALQVEFTRLFEAGEAGPNCPLREGHYGGGSDLQTLEELVRFYNFFGLSLPDERREQPDHLTTELEFLHFLSFQEAQAGVNEESLRGLQRAQRDFLARHPLAWLPPMRQALAAAHPMRFFIELTRLLERFLESEHRRLAVLAGEA